MPAPTERTNPYKRYLPHYKKERIKVFFFREFISGCNNMELPSYCVPEQLKLGGRYALRYFPHFAINKMRLFLLRPDLFARHDDLFQDDMAHLPFALAEAFLLLKQ